MLSRCEAATSRHILPPGSFGCICRGPWGGRQSQDQDGQQGWNFRLLPAPWPRPRQTHNIHVDSALLHLLDSASDPQDAPCRTDKADLMGSGACRGTVFRSLRRFGGEGISCQSGVGFALCPRQVVRVRLTDLMEKGQVHTKTQILIP